LILVSLGALILFGCIAISRTFIIMIIFEMRHSLLEQIHVILLLGVLIAIAVGFGGGRAVFVAL